MANQRIAGMLELSVNGEVQSAKGEFEYNLGHPKREAVVGADGTHGYKETPQVAYMAGTITDRGNLDVEALVKGDGVTVTLNLANGKTIVGGDCWYAGDGTVKTGEAEIDVRWESPRPLQET